MIGALTIFYSLLVVTLFVPIVGGLYVRRARPLSAMAAIVAGVLTLCVFSIGLFGSLTAGLDPTLTAIIAAAVAFGVATLTAHRRNDAPQTSPQTPSQ